MKSDDLCEDCKHTYLEHQEGWNNGNGCSHIDKAHARCCSDDYCECRKFVPQKVFPKFKIVKSYKGGQDTYYIDTETCADLLENSYGNISNKMLDEDILEDIDLCTDGGHAYGSKLTCEKVDTIPNNAKILCYKEYKTYVWALK